MIQKLIFIAEYPSPTNTKFQLATLSNGSSDIFCATDESRTIFIWKKSKEQPIIVFLY